jgi:hypothetical protein
MCGGEWTNMIYKIDCGGAWPFAWPFIYAAAGVSVVYVILGVGARQGWPKLRDLAQCFDRESFIGGLNLAHDFGQLCAIFVQ